MESGDGRVIGIRSMSMFSRIVAAGNEFRRNEPRQCFRAEGN
jgi:hypothetical protein